MKTTTAALAIGLTPACVGPMQARKDDLWVTKIESQSHSIPFTYLGGGFLRDPTSDVLIADASSKAAK
jgi:hypothetical protein